MRHGTSPRLESLRKAYKKSSEKARSGRNLKSAKKIFARDESVEVEAGIQSSSIDAVRPDPVSKGDDFMLYDCDHCDYLCAVRVGEDPGVPHVCGADASGDSDSDSTASISESESDNSDSAHPVLGPGQLLDEEGHVRDPRE